MTRTAAARALGITRARLTAHERDGTAQPERDERGAPRYTEPEVERLRQILGSPNDGSRRKHARTAAKKAASVPSTVNAIVVASDATKELIDQAEQLEAAARVTLAERRLAELQGEIEARDRELAELRTYRAQREAVDAQQQATLAWRSQRIGVILASHADGLRLAGFDEQLIAYAIAAAHAILAALPNEGLVGAAYPTHVAHGAIADALRIARQDPPLMVATMIGPTGLFQQARAIGPGD